MNTNNLKYLTVKIASETDDGTLSVGTGFYIRFGDIPMIVTANHVISEKSNIKLKLRYKIGEHIAMIDFPCNVKWHTLPKHDLACYCVDEIERDFEKLVGIMSRTVTENLISSANLGIYSEAYHLLELKEKIKKK